MKFKDFVNEGNVKHVVSYQVRSDQRGKSSGSHGLTFINGKVENVEGERISEKPYPDIKGYINYLVDE